MYIAVIYTDHYIFFLILLEDDWIRSMALAVMVSMNPMPHIPALSKGFPAVTVMTRIMQDHRNHHRNHQPNSGS